MTGDHYVGVGCVEAQLLPFAVLRHSITRRASRPVQVEPLFRCGIEVPVPQDERNRQKTPFSFQRFLIPQARGYKGRGIYLDSDMLVFGDISSLFEYEFGNANVLAVPKETSVMVLDCNHLKWNIRELAADLDAGRLSYDGLMTCRAVANVNYTLPGKWNWLDNSTSPMPPGVALLHYTVTSSQPWISSGHPLGHFWLKELFDALDDGTIHYEEVAYAVQQGFVRPSLLHQVDQRVTRKEDIPRNVLAEDEPFASYCRSVRYVVVEGFRH